MCLGIPGEVVELLDSNRHLAKVDVAGVRRNINIDLWRTRMWCRATGCSSMSASLWPRSTREAQRALEGLQLMGQAYTDEIQAVVESHIA